MAAVRLAPYVMARLAGLPGALLAALGSPTLTAQWQRLAELTERLAQEGAPLCDALHPIVARCGDADPAGRTRIINLRRAIHNGRRPPALEAVWPMLERLIAQALADWVRLFSEREELQAALPSIWANEALRVRGELQAWSGDEAFQAGLVLASESIWQKLQEYRATALEAQAARLRKMEPALAMYLTRASAKTSPFSTFALVSAGGWAPGMAPLQWQEGDGVHARSLPLQGIAALNQAVLNRLAAAAARHPALRRSALLRRGALVRIETDRLVAYGRIDQAGNTRVAFTGERLVALPRNPTVERVWEEVGQSSIRWRALVQRLGPPSTWEPVIAFMLDHHLLEIGWGVDESNLDFPGALAKRIRPMTNPLALEFRRHLQELSELTQALPGAPAAARPELGKAMTETLQAAFTLVGAEPGDLAAPPVFEEVGLKGASLSLGRDFWAPAVADLALLQRLLPLFAQRRVRQRAIRDAFIAQFGPGGRCSDVAAFLLGLPPRLTSTPDPIITNLRAQFGDLVREAAAADGRLNPAVIKQIAEGIPPDLRAEPIGFGYFVQPLPSTGRLVLTEITPGFGRAPARFANLIAALAPAIADHLPTALPPGIAFMEIPGTFGFNASRRPALIARQLRYPGAELAAGALPIDLQSLQLVEAEGALHLIDGQSGERLVPLDLHALTPLLGPELWARLMELQPGAAAAVPIQSALYSGASDQIQHLPQIRLGQIVLSRRSWIVPNALLPHRPKGSADWEWATAVEDWRRAHDLPQQVYIRATLDPAGRFFQGITTDRPVRDQQRKPQYIDFSSPILLRVFERHLEEAEELLVIEERLPGPADWLPGPDGDPRVMEWYLELDGGGDQHVADDTDQLLG